VLLLISIVFANIIAVLNNCLSSYDIGLYYQALVNMADGEVNPYLTIRTLNIFNDHFEPILFLAVPSVFLSGFSPVGPIIFEWSIFCFFIFGLIKIKGYQSSNLIFFLCLFSRGILTALNFPIHPNTWSMISWLSLVYFIYKGNFKLILISAFSLILYRESNVFALVGLFFFYLTSLDKKKIVYSFLTCLLALFVVFKLRPWMVGATYDYGGVFIRGILDKHVFFIIERLSEVDIKSFLKVFFPFIVPTVLAYKAESRPFLKSNLFLLLCLLAPVFFLHLLAGKIHYHYGITFIAPLLCYFILSPDFLKFFENKKIKYFILISFFITSTSTYTRWINESFLNKSKNCIISSEKRDSTEGLKIILNEAVKENETIFSTNRIVPIIVKRRRKIYVPSHFTKHLETYDYILLEKRSVSLFNSLSVKEFENAMKVCRKEDREILLNDEFYLLMKGPFKPICFNLFSSL
jgi:uncharacterized membrane protein